MNFMIALSVIVSHACGKLFVRTSANLVCTDCKNSGNFEQLNVKCLGKMLYNSRHLKVVSIVELVMTAIVLILGLVDQFKVRYVYTNFLLSPCWTAAIVSTL